MYQITIKEITTKEIIAKEYEKIADTGGTDNGAKYGYVKTEKEVEVERIVLQQETDEINIEEVIKAINNIK